MTAHSACSAVDFLFSYRYPSSFLGGILPDKFRVGLVQISATPDPEKNLQRAIDRMHQAQAKGAQIVRSPELFQTKYFCQREDAELFDLAEPIPGSTAATLS